MYGGEDVGMSWNLMGVVGVVCEYDDVFRFVFVLFCFD